MAMRASARSLKQEAYRSIRAKILSGELSPGDPVLELVLSRELGISRTPIREAIGQLAAEGLLDQEPGRGTVVTQVTRDDLVELYELREVLEVYAVSKAAQHDLDPADAAALEQSCGEILELKGELGQLGIRRLNTPLTQRFVNADLRFHLLLLRSTGNRRMMKIVADTRLLMRIISIQREGHDAQQLEEIHRYHRGILDAVRGANGGVATDLMAKHIQKSREERLALYDRWERLSKVNLDALIPQLETRAD